MSPDDSGQGSFTAAPKRLRRRRDFVRATKTGLRLSRDAFSLQMAQRGEDEFGPPRFGFTVTKKVAGAVGRNRIRRRLKEALRLSGAEGAANGEDYVFIARSAALTSRFDRLVAQMAEGIARLTSRRAEPRRPNSKKGPEAS